MNKVTVRKSLGLLLTLALAVSMLLASVGSVFASTSTDADDPETPAAGNLTKSVVAADNATFDETFTFTFTALDGDGTKAVEAKDLDTQTITVKAEDGTAVSGVTKTAAGDGTSTYTAGLTLIGDGGLIGENVGDEVSKTDFPHAGEYVYEVKETAGTASDWSYDDSTFRLKVYVANGSDGKLILQGITVAKGGIQDTKGPAGEKVDPADPDDGEMDFDALKGFTFLNKYAPKATLEIINDITGDYADLTKEFDFTDIEVKLPDVDPTGDGVTAKIVRADGTTEDLTGNIEVKDGVLTIPDQKLGKDDKIVIEGLPAGSDYSYNVGDEEGYTVKAVNTNSEGENETVDGKTDEGLTVPNSDITKLTPGNNTSLVTNTYRAVTPTGVIVKVLPFALMILIAVAGIALNLRNRRSRYTA